MELDKAIKERHSVRRFSTKKVKWQDIIEVIDTANQAPLAGNIPCLKFILVNEEDKIKQLAEAAQQDFIENVEYVIVVCTNPAQVERSYGERTRMYTRQQAGAAIQNLLLKLTELGLATCWVGAFVDDMVRVALKIPYDVDVEALLPVGYEMPPKSKQRRKTDLDNSLFFNVWKNKYMRPLKKPEGI